MLISMTGFAQGAAHYKNIQLHVEIRSLNHRYFECLTHLPEGLGAVEEMVKTQVKNKINRGRVSVVLSIEKRHPRVQVDYDLAENYLKTLRHLGQRLKLNDTLSLNEIIHLEGIIRVEKITPGPEFMQAVKLVTNKALEQLTLIRQKEGKALSADILGRLSAIQKEVEKIIHCEKKIEGEKKRLLSEEEYSVFSKNTDISEELTRISYHCRNFLATIKKPAACGKELDFISQEIQREANTISAKAQSAKISSSVVKIKSGIDRIREQVQNVE